MPVEVGQFERPVWAFESWFAPVAPVGGDAVAGVTDVEYEQSLPGDVDVQPLGSLGHHATVEAQLQVAEVDLIDTGQQLKTGKHEIALTPGSAAFEAWIRKSLKPQSGDAFEVCAEGELVVVVIGQLAGSEHRGVTLNRQLRSGSRAGSVRLDPLPAIQSAGISDLLYIRCLPFFSVVFEPGQRKIKHRSVLVQLGL